MAEPAAAGAGGAFEADTAVALVRQAGARSRFAAEVSPDWRAGRGPHGGYLAAILLRAMTLAVGDPARAPRSLTIHYARAPQPGPVSVETVIERAGRSLSTVSARMEQEGRLTALVLGAFSVPWSGPEIDDMPMPPVAPARAPGPPRCGTSEGREIPPMAAHITLQPRFGGRPFSGEEQPMEFGGWLGHAEERASDALSLVFFVDALIPDPFMRLPEPNAAPTIDLTVHFRCAPAAPGAGTERLCLARTRCRLIHEGFFEEDGILWGADGRVLAQSRQLALLLPMG